MRTFFLLRELRRSLTATIFAKLSNIFIMKEFYIVYIALCSDGSYYVGCTNDLPQRIIRHEKGEVQYTKTRLPIPIITHMTFTDKYMAYNFEKYLKTGSGRAFMYKRLVKKNV